MSWTSLLTSSDLRIGHTFGPAHDLYLADGYLPCMESLPFTEAIPSILVVYLAVNFKRITIHTLRVILSLSPYLAATWPRLLDPVTSKEVSHFSPFYYTNDQLVERVFAHVYASFDILRWRGAPCIPSHYAVILSFYIE